MAWAAKYLFKALTVIPQKVTDNLVVAHPSSVKPLQLSSIPLPQISVAPILMAAFPSLQSWLFKTYPIGCVQAIVETAGLP
jgi:hypothetical protein